MTPPTLASGAAALVVLEKLIQALVDHGRLSVTEASDVYTQSAETIHEDYGIDPPYDAIIDYLHQQARAQE